MKQAGLKHQVPSTKNQVKSHPKVKVKAFFGESSKSVIFIDYFSYHYHYHYH